LDILPAGGVINNPPSPGDVSKKGSRNNETTMHHTCSPHAKNEVSDTLIYRVKARH
jgi:hypothetical protein